MRVAVSAHEIVAGIPDPEIPVITIEELGVLRSVVVEENGRVVVTITPTYSGCPAMDMIRRGIASALHDAGYADIEVRTALEPAWTSDWLTERGKERLREFGIAPPAPTGTAQLRVACPRCGSTSTRLVSRFGSTACKAHRVCGDCLEPFDHFKTL